MKTYDIPSVRTIPAIRLEPERLTKILSGTRKIFVAIPSRLDAVKCKTLLCLLDAQCDALMRCWALEVHSYAGIEPISACRNLVLAEFLASDCSDLMWIDDDLEWERGAVMRMIDHPADFVIGIYRYRGDPEGYPVRHDLSKRIESDPVTGLIEIHGGGFGFTKLTRACVEKMVAAYPELEYPLNGMRAWKLFALDQKVDGIEFSEDMLFCHRWREIGGTVWADPEITMVHMGVKGFIGHYGDFLRGKMKEIEKQAA